MFQCKPRNLFFFNSAKLNILLITSFVCLAQNKIIAQELAFKTPKNELMADAINRSLPDIIVAPTKNWILQLRKCKHQSLSEYTSSEIRLAGLHFNCNNYASNFTTYYDSITLTETENGKDFSVIGITPGMQLGYFTWSPDGRYIAFTNTTNQDVELYILDISKHKAEKLTQTPVNNCMPQSPVSWIDNEWMVFTARIKPTAATTQVENSNPVAYDYKGQPAAGYIHPDFIQNKNDEKLFENCCTSQLTKININKKEFQIGEPAIFKSVKVSPDTHFLLVKMIQTPYSYETSFNGFPFICEIWDNQGNLFRELFKISVADNLPTGIDAVRKGPRCIDWRNDKPSTLYWVSALDGGNSNQKTVVRDRLYLFDPPFDGNGYESVALKYRFKNVQWGNEHLAICYEQDEKTGETIISSFDPAQTEPKKYILFSFNRYLTDAGTFLTSYNESGHEVLLTGNKGTELYIAGQKSNAAGLYSFINKFMISENMLEPVWQSEPGYSEKIICAISSEKLRVISCRESKSDVPNYFTRNLENGVVSQLTNFTNPTPELAKMNSQLLVFNRTDGGKISGHLNLPPGYSIGDKQLPFLICITPVFVPNKESAKTINLSPSKFPVLTDISALPWLIKDYAVIQDLTFPIIISPDGATYSEQIKTSADAILKCIDSLAIADKSQLVLFGFDNAAAMVIDLLAASNKFAGGIAINGSYNKTLSPLNHEYTYDDFWQKPEEFIINSAINQANKVSQPVLLIHSEKNEKYGYGELQSQLMFQALKANGIATRLVILPFEGSKIMADDNLKHCIWEIDRWLWIIGKKE